MNRVPPWRDWARGDKSSLSAPKDFGEIGWYRGYLLLQLLVPVIYF